MRRDALRLQPYGTKLCLANQRPRTTECCNKHETSLSAYRASIFRAPTAAGQIIDRHGSLLELKKALNIPPATSSASTRAPASRQPEPIRTQYQPFVVETMSGIPGNLANQWTWSPGPYNACQMNIRCRGPCTYILVTNVPVREAQLKWFFRGNSGIGTRFQRSGRYVGSCSLGLITLTDSRQAQTQYHRVAFGSG